MGVLPDRWKPKHNYAPTNPVTRLALALRELPAWVLSRYEALLSLVFLLLAMPEEDEHKKTRLILAACTWLIMSELKQLKRGDS